MLTKVNRWGAENPVTLAFLLLIIGWLSSASSLFIIEGAELIITFSDDTTIVFNEYYLFTIFGLILLYVTMLTIFSISRNKKSKAIPRLEKEIESANAIVSRFKQVGLEKVDLSIEDGLQASEMLTNVKRDFKFLGTGANKLTTDPELFKNVLKCGGAEFLVCDPSSPALKQMGARANDDYVEKVTSSINKLKKYVDEGHDIKLRLYYAESINDMPIYRLAFYNDLCLCSYNYFSTDIQNGKQLPQLHIKKSPTDSPETTYYYAMTKYYERLWEQNVLNQYASEGAK